MKYGIRLQSIAILVLYPVGARFGGRRTKCRRPGSGARGIQTIDPNQYHRFYRQYNVGRAGDDEATSRRWISRGRCRRRRAERPQRLHGRDEGLKIDSFYTGVEFYYEFLKALTSGSNPRHTADNP